MRAGSPTIPEHHDESGAGLFAPDDDDEDAPDGEADGFAGPGMPGSHDDKRRLPDDLKDRADVQGPPPSISEPGHVGGTGGEVQRAKPRPSPREPTQAEYDEHMLTHAQYRSWCPYCPATARPNDPHRELPAFSRSIPLFVADYCF